MKTKLFVTLFFAFVIVLFSFTAKSVYAQDDDEDTSKTEETSVAPLPDVGLTTKGLFFESREFYQYFHTTLDAEYRNDQIPAVLCGANKWAMEKGRTTKMKFRDKIYYVWDAQRPYHIDHFFEFCFTVAPGYWLPTMIMHPDSTIDLHGTVRASDIVPNKDKTGYNFLFKPIKLPEGENFEEVK